MFFPWILCCVLLISNFIFILKILFMKKDLEEISIEFRNCLKQRTNNLITISTRDYHIRKVADEINIGLRQLREQRHKYMSSDQELKDAVTNISHDLKTPLTAICGYLDLLEREAKSDTVDFYIEQIQNRTECIRQLTEEMFRYSVIVSSQEDNREDVILNNVLEENLLSHYGTFTKRDIEPVVEIPDIPIHCYINLTAFNRIVGNILSNALKYSDGDLSVKLYTDGTISFRNSAKDLTPVMVERLFDRFYTVETGRNSTGLGLSVAKVLTERMGGQIKAVYEKEKLTICIKFK